MSATDTRAVVQQLVDALTGALPLCPDSIATRYDTALGAGLALLAALPEQPAAPQGDSVAGSGLPLDTVRTGEEATELLPCPFCGGKPAIVTRDVEPQGDSWYGRKDETFVLCDCGACLFDEEFHEGFYDAETRAVVAWNRRAPLGAVSVPAETASGAKGQDQPKQPLTDEEVEPLFRQVKAMPVKPGHTKDEWFWFAWGVEMGERAHGITGGSSNE